MAVHYGQSEPILLDEEILQGAVVEQFTQHQAARIAKTEGVRFKDTLKLSLEYRNILRIDHLWDFTSLVRLDMNNNLIKNMEGLERLVNLTWLNLSFNRIEKINGLDSLRKLELLNLSNNKISIIENMDTLEKLTHFLISNNLLGQIDNVLYLRKFKNLYTINLCGNPVSKVDDYKLLIAAYFPNLVCLDYRLLDKDTKEVASDKYQYLFEEMIRDEQQKQQAKEAEQQKEADLKLHKEAFVEFLNGSYLFKSMFRDDPEAEALHRVSGVAELLQTFEEQMVQLCMQLFETGLAEHKQREAEVNAFLGGQARAVTDTQQKAAQILSEFKQKHKERMVELQQISDPNLLEVKLSQCNNEIDQLCKSLMALEFRLISQLEENINKFDVNISDMVGSFSETAQGLFAQCRDLEDGYHEKVREIAVATLEKVAQDTLEEDMPDDVKTLFTDRVQVMDAVHLCHENHLMRINDRETQLVNRASAWKVALIKGIQDKELKRNRMRISDIQRYKDHLREQLEEFQ